MIPALALAFAFAVDLAGIRAPQEPEAIRLTIRPAAAPVPALKYRLLPDVREEKPGNAAACYLKALSGELLHKIERPEYQKGYEAWLDDPSTVPGAEFDWLLKDPTLQAIDEGARRAYCDWELIPDLRKRGWAASVMNIQHGRIISDLLAMRARLQIAQGQTDEAIATIQTGLSFSRHVGDGPALIQHLVGTACSFQTLTQVEELIKMPRSANFYWALTDLPRPLIQSRSAFEAERLMVDHLFPGARELIRAKKTEPISEKTHEQFVSGLLEMLSGHYPPLQFLDIQQREKDRWQRRLNLAQELAMLYPHCKGGLIDDGWPAKKVAAMPMVQVVVLHQVSLHDRLYDDIVKWIGAPYWDIRDQIGRAERKLNDYRAQTQFSRITVPCMLMPACEKCLAAGARLDRRIAALRCIEAIRLYASAHDGKPPARWSDIKEVPIPIDPMTGKEFRYWITGGRIHLVAVPNDDRAWNVHEFLHYELTFGRSVSNGGQSPGEAAMKLWFAALVLPICTISASAAQKPLSAESRAKLIAPFVNDQTLIVVHVDPSRIDLDALTDKIAALGKLERRDAAEGVLSLRRWLEPLRNAGVRDVYQILSLKSPGRETIEEFFVIPLARGANADTVEDALDASQLCSVTKRMGKSIVGCNHPDFLKRLEKWKAAPRPELERAFAAAGDTAIQQVLLPLPRDYAKALEEVMPSLPKELGGGSIKMLTSHFQWAALGVDVSPNLALRFVAHGDDPPAKELTLVTAIYPKLFSARRRLLDPLLQLQGVFKTVTLKNVKNQLVLSLGGKELDDVLRPTFAKLKGAADRQASLRNLRHLGLAMHNYHDAHRGFPAVANYDKAGTPLLSWRVHLLPYLEIEGAEELHREFKLDEAWDSPHNKKLIAKMPAVFRNPLSKVAGQGKTTYLAPFGKGFIFEGAKRTRMPFEDGTSFTILLLEVDDDHAVPWTKPADLPVNAKDPHKGLRRVSDTFRFLMADCSMRTLPASISAQSLYAGFTIAGGEVLGREWDD
jgi:hypothetical protein